MISASALSAAKLALLARMRAGQAGELSGLDEVDRRSPHAPVPLSAGQRQVWTHQAASADPLLYNESVTIHRWGECDLAALEASLRALVDRHEALRTCFLLGGTQPQQIIAPVVDLPVPFDDVSDLTESDRDAAAVRIATDDASKPFDLTQAPLFRARIVRIAPDYHRLYLALHHLIFDGVSLYRVLVPELISLYQSLADDGPSSLAPVALDYGDYAVWQQDRPAGKDAPSLEHWRRNLLDPPDKLDLTGDLRRPVLPGRGDMEKFAVPSGLTSRLRELARRSDVTPYTTLLAAFATLLHRYSGQDDIIVGGLTDLRRRPELERVVGYFLNAVPLRVRPHETMSFAEFLGETQRTALDAAQAGDVPFDDLVQALDLRRTAGNRPLFDILFSVQPPLPPLPVGWDLTQTDVSVGSAKYDLYLEIDDRPDGYVGRFLYDPERFDRATIRRFIDHLLRVIEVVTIDPSIRLSDVALASAGELDAVAAWSQVGSDRSFIPLPMAVAAQARATPDAVALVDHVREWSYAELDAMADGWSARLASKGVGRGALVGVCLDRSSDLVAALIGIMRAGAAYCPLDPALPQARMAWIVADARLDALVTEAGLKDRVPVPGLPVLLKEQTGSAAGSTAAVSVDERDLAYVLYTSGSTGRPKGVEIEHRALMNLLSSMQAEPGFTRTDRLLALTTVGFDIAGLELFLPLISGGAIILAPAALARDPKSLILLIEKTVPTVMQATPATWRALIDAGYAGHPRLTILCGGEALPPRLAAELRTRCVALWNLYGPTETTIWSTLHQVEESAGPIPIGHPIACTNVHVLGTDGWPVPPDTAGELFIGGVGLARGYRNAPDLTAARFVEKPFAPGLRLYRTGDVVRQNAEGTLLYEGRADNEEKIRGFRVAVEEVEQALGSAPGVAVAVVRGWPDASGERSLVGYVVERGGQCLDMDRVRQHLARVLPGYMIPSRFVTMDALPLTPSGKVDRRALPERQARPEPTAPADDQERRLAALWKDVLQAESIGRNDDFFDLGGHSLLAARLMQRVEEEFSRPVTMADLFAAPRLRQMADLLRHEGSSAPALIPLQPEGFRPPLLWLSGGPAFRALALAMDRKRPFLGVPIEHGVDPTARGPTFEDHADRVADLVWNLKPEGSFSLGGWCASGILAYAVASRLRAAGAEIALVILGDAENPTRSRSLDVTRRKAVFHLKELFRLPQRERSGYLRQRIGGYLATFRTSPQPLPAWADNPMLGALIALSVHYRPPPYKGAVGILCSSEWVQARDVIAGWAPVLRGRVLTRQMPGRHQNQLWGNQVSLVATAIEGMLAEAEGLE